MQTDPRSLREQQARPTAQQLSAPVTCCMRTSASTSICPLLWPAGIGKEDCYTSPPGNSSRTCRAAATAADTYGDAAGGGRYACTVTGVLIVRVIVIIHAAVQFWVAHKGSSYGNTLLQQPLQHLLSFVICTATQEAARGVCCRAWQRKDSSCWTLSVCVSLSDAPASCPQCWKKDCCIAVPEAKLWCLMTLL